MLLEFSQWSRSVQADWSYIHFGFMATCTYMYLPNDRDLKKQKRNWSLPLIPLYLSNGRCYRFCICIWQQTFYDFATLEKLYTKHKQDSSRTRAHRRTPKWGVATELIWWVWKMLSLSKERTTTQPITDFLFLPKINQNRLAINTKISDLKKTIPLGYRQFYVELQSHPTCSNSADPEYGD